MLVWFLWVFVVVLGLGYLLIVWVVLGKFGSVICVICDDEVWVCFLGYFVEGYKLVIFILLVIVIVVVGVLYYL